MKRKSTSDNCVGKRGAKRGVLEDCPSVSRGSSCNPDGISTPDNDPGRGLENLSSGEARHRVSAASAVNEGAWPSCWTVEQKDDHCQKNDWLFFNGGKLGCSVCKNVGTLGTEKLAAGSRLSKEWMGGEVSFYGESRKQHLTSLRKKICEHRESLGHKAAVKITAEELRETLETAEAQEREMETTKRIFRTAYKVARKNQSFNDLGADIDLQELNGIDVGSILYPATSCARIVDHIGSEMRIVLIRKITESKSKISLLLDESTTVSQKPVLIAYIRSYIEEMDMEDPMTLFVGLIELDDVTANGIFRSLVSALDSMGITEKVLKESLVSLTCDGAVGMIGSRVGVAKLFKDRFPSIIVWPCASHRLEASVHEVVKEVWGINRFKSFMDELYAVYHSSPKNARELGACAAALETEILKIGRVLSTTWVASCYRAVIAVWKDYEALVLHFEKAQTESGRDRKERQAYEGLQKTITSSEFVLDLGLLCDALQELSELSVDLQERNIDLYRAHGKIESLVEICGERVAAPGPHYREVLEAAAKLQFKGVRLRRRNRMDDPPISPVAFYEQLKKSLQNRLLSREDLELSRYGRILESQDWPANPSDCVLYGEAEIGALARRFRLSEREAIRAFREHLKYREEMPKDLSRLCHIFNTVAVSSGECERGLSQLNLIVTPERSSLIVKTITSLLFIRIVGPPLQEFDPTKFVTSWLLQGHRSHLDTQSKTRKRTEESGDRMRLWRGLCG